MPRADAFDAFYRDASGRLLHQVYAVTGSVEGARQSVGDAFVAAAHHWRKLERDPEREAWVRQQALRVAHRNRVTARASYTNTPEASRQLFQALRGRRETDRHLLVANLLAGLDLSSAAREVGLTDDAAQASLAKSESELTQAGVDLSTRSLADRLAGLRDDLRDVPSDRARRLRREGNRRRRSHLVLAGTAALALAIGAGALTAAKPDASAVIESLPGTTPPTTPAEPAPETFEQPDFTVAQLTSLDAVQRLDPDARWRIVGTSTDFGPTIPIHPCLGAMPADPRARHLWVRQLTTARSKQPSLATEMLKVSPNPGRAAVAYDRVVASLATCPRGGYEVTTFAKVTAIGDDATLVRLASAARRSVSEEQIVVARTGRALIAWLVQASDRHPVADRRLEKLMYQSVNDVCGYADGTCAGRNFEVHQATPPAVPRAVGFLGAVDMPVLPGLRDPWVPTDPKRTRRNPAATQCDRADFAEAGATAVRTRSFVVPTAEKLATIFGMTQTVGEFRTSEAARGFVRDVRRAVATCADRQLSLEVPSADEVFVKRGSGNLWLIRVGTSEKQALVFRMMLVRVGGTVTQVTFTPTRRYDVTHVRYVELARQAAARLSQL
jgi:hypothetical protein